MAARKRALAAVLSEVVRLRFKLGKAMVLVDQLAGKGVVDADLGKYIDSELDKNGLTPAEAADLVARVERGDFSLDQARRMKGNGERPRASK